MLSILWKSIGAVFVMFMLLSTPAMASCDGMSVSGLSDSAIIELKKKCVEIQNQASSAPTVTANQLEEYADLGKKYGVALSEVAKSVGTTVNDLAQTPVGMFMLALVGWKVIGHDLLGVVGGTIWFTVMIPLWVYFFVRLVLKDRKVEETYDNTTGKLSKKIQYPINYENGPGPIAFVMLLVLFSICVAGFTMIF